MLRLRELGAGVDVGVVGSEVDTPDGVGAQSLADGREDEVAYNG